MKSSDDIKLRKVGDPEPEKNTLPRGVFAMVMNGEVYFIKRMAGRFVPLPDKEQEQLRKKHIV